ncbi:hypothetical protein EJ02DRAFT_458963 [Clathrospora elynae]|uniref:Uncharacterized protein n=1 Tax=Clathrospora elynae TaxID=706981 RepID=A0A6A5SIF5_9PLEO|nr:hypothetical protein EJ02DRAFT_458963 [Clathrospora elynae]
MAIACKKAVHNTRWASTAASIFIGDCSGSDNVSRNGNVGKLMDFAYRVEPTIDRDAEHNARFEAILRDLHKRT